MIYKVKIDKLTINNTKGDYKSYVYVAPTNEEGVDDLGQLFIIVEAKSREKKIPAMLGQIVEELSEYYYHSPTKNTEAALETTSQYFNENIVDITGKNLKWIKEKMSVLIGSIDQNKLILSNYNNIKVWLLRDNKIHDITSGQSEIKKDSKGKKILSQLISGQLMNNDSLLLTNSTIFDYFSDEKIKKTLGSLAPTQACAFFKNTLLDFKSPVDFSSIIIKFSSFKKESEKIKTALPTQSLGDTDEINELNREKSSLPYKIGLLAKKSIQTGLQKSADNLKKLRSNKITKKNKEDDSTEPTKSLDSNELDKPGQKRFQFERWKKLNIIEYRLIIMIVIVGLLFGVSLLFVNSKKDKQIKNETFTEVSNEIDNKINSAEAALIYKDENKAQELLSEANTLLKSLDQSTPEQQYKYQSLKNKINAQINRIFKLEKIEGAQILANLEEGFLATSNVYISTDNIIYLARGGEIYKVNNAKQTVDKIAEIAVKIIKILGFEKNKLVLLTSQNDIWMLDTLNNSTRKISMELPSDKSVVKDISIYAKKLYLLDSGENNIYKYSYSTTNFSNPSAWIKEDTDVTGNNSLVVDGNIWLSAADEKVSKFFKGKREVFSLKGLYEPISQQTILTTNENLDNLYLLDHKNNRIIVASKQGRVIKQLLGDEMERIISITTNNDESELYILTVDRVYKFRI